MDLQTERRQNERFAARYNAEVRYRSGLKLQLPVLDISVGGCMVDARSWSIRPGELVAVKLPGLGYQPAEVVWIEDQRAGIVFEEPLYGPTLEHLNQLAA
ncbi:MAG: hypothetical protein APF78_12185 [Sphingomonadales bacterium BRH_c3]|nr:MAG: hypothetical protein APF78_12185 [Sphingomonadales bacterium BRH_c3]